MYIHEQCRRLLHSSHEVVIEAQMPCDAQARHVDVFCFTEADTDRAVQPVVHAADATDTDRAVQPVTVETHAKNNDDDVRSNSSEEGNILDDSGAPEDAHADRLETHSVAQPSESHGIEIDTDHAAPPVQSQSIADIKNEDEQQASKHLDDGGNAEAFEEDQHITALETTTSAHDDWLHRGKFLWHMDFHTYIALLFANLFLKTRRFPIPTGLSIAFSSTVTTHWPCRIGNSWLLTGTSSLSSWRR